jgi:hypothetical protein
MSGFRKAFQDAKYMLDFEPGWGGDDDSVAIKQETFDRAMLLCANLEYEYIITTHTEMPTPVVSPCVNGSVDICWSTPLFEFLINVKPDPKEKPTYYCDQGGKFEKVMDKYMGMIADDMAT